MVVGSTSEDEVVHMGERGSIDGSTCKAIAVSECGGRGIVDEAQGVALILALVEGGGGGRAANFREGVGVHRWTFERKYYGRNWCMTYQTYEAHSITRSIYCK